MVAECRRRFVALEIGAHPVCPPVSARAAGVVQSVARCQDRNREQSGHRRLLAPRCRSEANRKSVKAQIRRKGNPPTANTLKPTCRLHGLDSRYVISALSSSSAEEP